MKRIINFLFDSDKSYENILDKTSSAISILKRQEKLSKNLVCAYALSN